MTAADVAEAVPEISLPGSPLVTSEACHWSPGYDVTYWREKESDKLRVIATQS